MVNKNKRTNKTPPVMNAPGGRTGSAANFLNPGLSKTDTSSFLMTNALGTAARQHTQMKSESECLLEAKRAFNEGRVRDAEKIIKQVMKGAPGNVQAMRLYAIVLRSLKKPKEALRILNKALKRSPDDKEVFNGLGLVHKETGNEKAARKAYEKALAIDPGFASANNNLGVLYRETGQFDAAINCFLKALEADPALPESWSGLARSQKYISPPPYLESLKEIAEKPFPGPIKRQAYFALGKICDDLGDYSQAFSYYSRANELYGVDVDPESDCRFMKSIQTFFSAQKFTELTKRHHEETTTPIPVFVLGLPRSGTTLVEQVLNAHPSIYCIGETHVIAEWAFRAVRNKDVSSGFPEMVGQLTEQALNNLYEAFLDECPKTRSKKMHVVEKTPFNYLYLGLISLAFPDAKIIHCKRDDMDRGVSIFFNDFSSSYPFTTNLYAIGRHTRAYHDLMAHWRSALPLSVLDVDYEDLARDQENVTRDILEFCDLPWDDRCLEFYNSDRLVNTPSDWQVRQPMFTSSIQRWQHYQEFLKPLRDGLDGIEQE